jgi:hypothetical protein
MVRVLKIGVAEGHVAGFSDVAGVQLGVGDDTATRVDGEGELVAVVLVPPRP